MTTDDQHPSPGTRDHFLRMTQLQRWGTIQEYVDLCRAQGYFTPAFYATALAHMERIHVRRPSWRPSTDDCPRGKGRRAANGKASRILGMSGLVRIQRCWPTLTHAGEIPPATGVRCSIIQAGSPHTAPRSVLIMGIPESQGHQAERGTSDADLTRTAQPRPVLPR